MINKIVIKIKEIINRIEINFIVDRILKDRDYKKLIYLKSDNYNDLNETGYIDYYDLIFIIPIRKFYPIPLIKNKKVIKDLVINDKIKLISRNWHNKYKEFIIDYLNKMENTNNYYPDFYEIAMLDEEDLYKLI